MFNYAKPGKGVRKNELPKSRFVHFFELFFRKFWKLVQVNLLYILFCIPMVTIGPATAGLIYVLRNMANEQPIFLFSDFWDAFKNNWKQSFVYSLLIAACAVLITIATSFYFANVGDYIWMYLPIAFSLFMGLMLILMSFYAMLMIVTLDLPLRSILKNAAILAILCLKANLFTLLSIAALIVVSYGFFPFLGALLSLFLTPALCGFIICYNSYPGIKKYAIDPYIEARVPEPKKEEGSTLFRDEYTENNS